jgi:methylmalonyl-CoA mutase
MPTTPGPEPFPPVGYAAWRAGVEAGLGADAVTRRLRATTEDGIEIEPLYAPGGPGDEAAQALADRVVGLLPEGNAGWMIRQRFLMDVSARDLRAALTCGVGSLEFTGDPTDEGFGRLGKRISALAPDTMSGVEISWEDVLPGEWSLGGASRLSLGIDPVGRWLRRGGSATDVRSEIANGAQGAARADGSIRLFRATGESFFDAGATLGMTLGATLAAALAYFRAFEAEGIELSRAARIIEVRLPCGPRFFESSAILRAARLVWARILEVSGITPTPLCIVASTGRRTLTRHDPWNNALRNTAVAFAAAIGGADILQLLPHDTRTGNPGDAALRLARTTGLVLREEASLGRVMDPAGGSWFLESLTASLAEEAWEELRRLDAAGGIIAAIESGELSRRIADAASARHERVLERRQPIIGVSEHPVPGEVAQRSAQEIVEEASGGLLPFRPDALPFEVLRDGELAR